LIVVGRRRRRRRRRSSVTGLVWPRVFQEV
jgi:hypothetical protein